MLPLLALLQAAAPAPAPAPDIELNVQLRAKRVTIEQSGEARVTVHAEPDAGSRVETNVQPKPEGRRELRNVTVEVHAQASLADPGENHADAETRPQG
jgi:uncharacterized protein (DUF58 family)